MIQELLGSGAGLIGGERRIPINGTILEATVPSPSPSPSPSSSSSSKPITASPTSTTTKSTTSSSTAENLRCPRCDSSNTKFCYYNNYNLTQPRHFCKTCRRYWTKGGALRNVPIGGGCRKNKTSSVSTSSSVGKSTTTNKMKTMACEIGRSGFGNGFDHIYELPSSPILWASPQSNSHIFSLLRAGATQNPNPNPSHPLSNPVKQEGGIIGTKMITEPVGGTSGRDPGLDHLCQVPSLGLCTSFWRNSHQQNGLIVDDGTQNSALQQLYQRLRSSTDYYSDSSSAVLLSNVGTSSATSTSSSTILESAPAVGGGDLSFWNPAAFSWSDLPTAANGAYHN